MERLKSDSFTAYLEAKQRMDQARKPSPGGTAFSLLTLLADAPAKQMPVTELMAASSMAFGPFADALKSLGDLGYLTLSGQPGSEVATLTKLGEEVSHLAVHDPRGR
jgi:predicted transcriptional regulator